MSGQRQRLENKIMAKHAATRKDQIKYTYYVQIKVNKKKSNYYSNKRTSTIQTK